MKNLFFSFLLIIFSCLFSLPLFDCSVTDSSTGGLQFTCENFVCHGDSKCLMIGNEPACVSAESSNSSDLTSVWIVVALVIGVILLERAYSTIKRMYQRKNGTEGFSQLQSAEAVEDGSMELVQSRA